VFKQGELVFIWPFWRARPVMCIVLDKKSLSDRRWLFSLKDERQYTRPIEKISRTGEDLTKEGYLFRDMVKIQPMKAPTGNIFYHNIVYKNTF